MLKHVLAASVAAAALVALSVPSFAATGTLTINGSVTAVCSIANPSDTIALGTLTLGADGKYAGQTLTHSAGDIWCNGTGNTVTFTAHALTNSATTTDTASFTNRIDYKVTGPAPTSLTADTTAGDPSNGTATTGAALPAFDTGVGVFSEYVLDIHGPAKKPIAGSYSGSIDLTVTPGS